MSHAATSDALPFRPQSKINTGKLSAGQDSDANYEDDEVMPPRRTEEDRLDRIERSLETLVTAVAKPVNGEKRRLNWFLGAIAGLTLLGAGANFVGNSGIWVGNRTRDGESIQKLQERFDNLRTLYILHFAEDPDNVDLQARQQAQDRERLRTLERERPREAKPKGRQ
jgi:hypothetical protein